MYYDQVQLGAKAPSQCGAQPARRQCGVGSHCHKGINSKNNNSDSKGESATTTITTAAADPEAARGQGADGGSEWARRAWWVPQGRGRGNSDLAVVAHTVALADIVLEADPGAPSASAAPSVDEIPCVDEGSEQEIALVLIRTAALSQQIIGGG